MSNDNDNDGKKRSLDDGNNNDNDNENNTTTNNTTTTNDDVITPITTEGDMPKKKFYRSRAHCNPLSHNDTFEYPMDPSKMNWCDALYYPNLPPGTVPTVLDIGCGFGGLTVALATLLPNEVVLGMEIRAKVAEYVRLRIVALRNQHDTANHNTVNDDNDTTAATNTTNNHHNYQNTCVLRTNSMKFLPHYFQPASLHKMFFCFPDPHFKRKNHPRRIISTRLLSEYAYYLKPTVGRLYCITDVKELHDWHVDKCDAHPLFRRIQDQECQQDPCVQEMNTKTEESQKVDRAGSNKYYAVYQRIPNEHVDSVTVNNFFRH